MRFRPALALFLLSMAVSAAATKDLSEYPLRVVIVETHWTRNSYGASGYGHGNIGDGDDTQGFEYTFDCGMPFNVSEGPSSAYRGRWKKEGSRLAILMVQIGNGSKQSECELKTSLQEFVYGTEGGHVITYTRSQFRQMKAAQKTLQSELHPADTNAADYPLAVAILEAHWDKSSVGGVSGSGRGNIRLGGAYASFDFSALCPAPLNVTTGGVSYGGRWEEQSTRLLVLGHPPGDNSPSAYHSCELKTDYRPTHVYIRNAQTGTVSAVTQEEFRNILEKRKAAQSAQSSTAKASSSPELGSTAKSSKLTNSDVISMVGSGLSSEVIVAKMNASECGFDTSPEGLKQLKGAHVPDALVLEMIKHSTSH